MEINGTYSVPGLHVLCHITSLSGEGSRVVPTRDGDAEIQRG